MTEPRTSVPGWLRIDVPNVARVYDYLLGGGHNFPADRAVAEQLLRILPNIELIAGMNRAFLRRAVLHLVQRGITQFLDLGSGIPTVGNVHEIAQKACPGARVVYVDRDEVCVAHTELLLDGNPDAGVTQADICEPWTVLGSPQVARLLDFSEPVGLLTVAVLHYLSDEQDPGAVLAAYRDALPPGSALALTHLNADHRPLEYATVMEAMRDSIDVANPRSYEEIGALFAGFDLVPPGVVGAARWRPDLHAAPWCGQDDLYAGIGIKP